MRIWLLTCDVVNLSSFWTVKNIWRSYIWTADKDMNESDLRSDVHYLGSSENKAWKKKIQACTDPVQAWIFPQNSQRPLPDISIVLAYSSIHFIFISLLSTIRDLNTKQVRQSRGKFANNLKVMVEYHKILGGTDIGLVICQPRLKLFLTVSIDGHCIINLTIEQKCV